jgi:nicotinamidase/pyrazinamidase
VRKGVDGGDGYSGFSVRDPRSGDVTRTELGTLLAEHAITTVVVVGLAGDVCVAATAEDAVALGFRTIVPLAATRMVELQEGDGARAVLRLREAGVEVVEPVVAP